MNSSNGCNSASIGSSNCITIGNIASTICTIGGSNISSNWTIIGKTACMICPSGGKICPQ